MSKRRAWWMLGAALLSLATWSCGSPPTPGYVRHERAAADALRSGNYGSAATEYEQAAEVAGSQHDADEARYRAATAHLRQGDRARARPLLEKLAATAENAELAARADFTLAELADDESAAASQRLAAIHRHPGSGNARSAFTKSLDYIRSQGGSAAALQFLKEQNQTLSGSELGEAVAYALARELDSTGRVAEARDAYLACAAKYPYPGGAYWDDALFRAAEAELRLGAPERAVTHLERMLAEREQARFVGSYEKGRYAEAQLKLGRIYRDALHDPARARRELRKVWLNHPKSQLADDALFEEALVARAANDDAGVCEPLRILAQYLPDSRFKGCAHELCATIPAGSKPCHDYIKRAAGLP